jgi:hypothetical protein
MSFLQCFQNSTDYSTTGGFSTHILFRGFLLPIRSRIKHNTLRGVFTIFLCRSEEEKSQEPTANTNSAPPKRRHGSVYMRGTPVKQARMFSKGRPFFLHERSSRYDSVLHLGLRITINVPLFKKLRDIIFFAGQ